MFNRNRRPLPSFSSVRRLSLSVPAERLDAAVAAAVLRALHSVGVVLTLEIRAAAEQVSVELTSDQRRLPELERAIRGTTADWSLGSGTSMKAPGGPMIYAAPIERPGVPGIAPLADLRSLGSLDPLTAILESVQPLSGADHLLVRYIVRPASAQRRRELLTQLRQPPTQAAPGGLFGSFARSAG